MSWARSFRDERAKTAALVAATNSSRLRIGGGARNVGVATPTAVASGASAQARAVQSAVRAKPALKTIASPPLPVSVRT